MRILITEHLSSMGGGGDKKEKSILGCFFFFLTQEATGFHNLASQITFTGPFTA